MCGTAGKGVKMFDTFPVGEREQDIAGRLFGAYQGESSAQICRMYD